MGPTYQQFNNKSSQVLGYLRRNVRIQDQHLKTVAYQTLPKPNLKHSASVWDPHEKKYKKQLEIVQRRAAWYIMSRYQNRSCVTEMLQELGLKI